jgi:phospholipid N-methyltransferase
MTKNEYYTNKGMNESIARISSPSEYNIQEFCAAFGVHTISIINKQYYPASYYPYDVDNKHLETVAPMFQNEKMWLIIFEEMCGAVFVSESTLRKLNYFDAFIEHMSQNQAQNQAQNIMDAIYFKIPSGANVYRLTLSDEPYTRMLYCSTFKSIEATFNTLNVITPTALASETNMMSKSLDMNLVESFSGIKFIDLETIKNDDN